jgi:DNA-binding winged helix-turn-helix (wHTH) protein/tetratricopeptide (TPR) repeat protein
MRGHFYEFGPFRLNPRERLLLKNARPVRHTPKAFDTLWVLVRHRGQLLEKDELIRAVWPDTFVGDVSLARNISVLRSILGDGPELIETVSKRGYRFAAPVRRIAEPLPAHDGGATTSIALLPFQLLGARPGEDRLALGLAQALILNLSKLPQLLVRSIQAMPDYESRDAGAAGRSLGVEWLIDGSTQLSGRRIRVTLQLVRVLDGATVWAEKIEEERSDLFAVQDEIAERLARAVRRQVSRCDLTRLASRRSESPEADRLYVLGRHYWSQRTERGLRRSIRCFRDAIAADPNFALAYAGIADAYALLGSFTDSFVPRDAARKARAAAIRALQLGDRRAEALTSVAFIRFRYDWDWAGAARDFRRAIELDPRYPTAHHWYAYLLSTLGHHQEALAEIRRAQALDPFSLPIATGVGRFLYFAGRYQEALAACRTAIDMDATYVGAHLDLGMIYQQLQLHDEAISEFRQALALSGDNQVPLVHLGNAYAASGRPAQAQGIMEDLRQRSARTYVAPFDWTLLYAGLGEKAQALAWLERACLERSSSLVLLAVEPLLSELRAEPRFQDVLRQIGLPARGPG